MARPRRDAALRASVQAVHDAVHGQLLVGAEVFGERVVLVLRPERGLVLELEIHRVLDCGNLVVVVAGWPRHDRAIVHFRPVRGVECGRGCESAFLAQLVGAEVGVLRPQLVVLRQLVEHLAAFAVPFGVAGLVEDLLGHVAGSYDCAWHDAGYLLPRPGEAEDVAGEGTDALPGLLHRACGLARLRVVDHDELRADRASVGLLALHAANAPRDAGHADEDAG